MASKLLGLKLGFDYKKNQDKPTFLKTFVDYFDDEFVSKTKF